MAMVVFVEMLILTMSLIKVKAITPAIGGVGLITTTLLLGHVVQACEYLNNSKTI